MFVQLTKEFLGKPAGERIDVADADADQLIRQGWAKPVEDDLLTPAIARAVQGGLDDAIERALQGWLRKQAATKPGGKLPFAGLGDSALDDPRAGFKTLRRIRPRRPRRLPAGQTARRTARPHGQDGVRPRRRHRRRRRLPGPDRVRSANPGARLCRPESPRHDRFVHRVEQLRCFPRNAETSRANGSRWGGVRAYWHDEGEQNTATYPTFGRLQLTLHKLFVMVNATDELLERYGRGIALEQYLFRVARRKSTSSSPTRSSTAPAPVNRSESSTRRA